MDALATTFTAAQNTLNGYLLASTIDPTPPSNDPAYLYNLLRSSTPHTITTDLRYKLHYNPALQLEKKEAVAWTEVYVAFYGFVEVLVQAEEIANSRNYAGGDPRSAAGTAQGNEWTRVYDKWKEVVNALYKGYQAGLFAAWTIPCLYVAGKYLRIFAIKADDVAAKSASISQRDSGLAFGGLQQEEDVFADDADGRNQKLEDAARQINRIFGLCTSDRSPLSDSRKWALYYTANLLFKTYFKLNSLSLCKNILRSIRATSTSAENVEGGGMPPLTAFPKAHQVTFMYYCGVIHFLEEDYVMAEEMLGGALQLCLLPSSMPTSALAASGPQNPESPAPNASTKNIQLILTYLIPTRLLTTHTLPSPALLAPYPRLHALFAPLVNAIRRADLRAFNAALEAGEEEFVKRRVYLTLERGRDIVVRNLFRKVFLAGGLEGGVRRTRVPVAEFAAALAVGGGDVGFGFGGGINDGNGGGWDVEEVECLIANAIYKNLMKGYIAHEKGMVVLSKSGAFPGTGV